MFINSSFERLVLGCFTAQDGRCDMYHKAMNHSIQELFSFQGEVIAREKHKERCLSCQLKLLQTFLSFPAEFRLQMREASLALTGKCTLG